LNFESRTLNACKLDHLDGSKVLNVEFSLVTPL
jgi:hypothetical protein